MTGERLDRRRTCWCGHRYRDHATGGTQCLAVTDDPDDSRRTGFCQCHRWEPRPPPKPHPFYRDILKGAFR